MTRFATVLIGLVVVGHASAQELDAKALTRIVAPYVNDTTQVVGHLEVHKIDLKKHFEMLVGFAAGSERDRKELITVRDFAMAKRAMLIKAGIRDILAVVNVSDFDGANLPEVVLVAPLGKNAEVDELINLITQIPGFTAKVENNTLLARFGEMKEAAPKDRPEFTAGLEALKDKDVQIIVSPSADLRRFAERMSGNLPAWIGDDGIAVLTQGIRWLGVGYVTSKLTEIYVLEAKDARSAKDLKAMAERAVAALTKEKGAPPELAKLWDVMELKQNGTRLTLVVDEKALKATLEPALARVRQTAQRFESIKNLQQIALALHEHHDLLKKNLPARASFDKDGKPLLSWRVHILPFIEQEALYKEFKLDEPWDSPNNKKLIARIPSVYASPLSKVGKDGKTTYLAVTGKGSMFEGKQGLKLTDVTDGLSNTIMVLEANDKKAVYWTQPEDFPIDTKEPLAGLVNPDFKGFMAVFGDASVRTLRATIRPATLQALFTRSGGENVDPDDD